MDAEAFSAPVAAAIMDAQMFPFEAAAAAKAVMDEAPRGQTGRDARQTSGSPWRRFWAILEPSARHASTNPPATEAPAHQAGDWHASFSSFSPACCRHPPLLLEHRVEIARRCGGLERLSLRCASKDWEEGASAAVDKVRLRALVWAADNDWGSSLASPASASESSSCPEAEEAATRSRRAREERLRFASGVVACFPNLRRLSLRGARGLDAEQLETLLGSRPPSLVEVDLCFARRLSWPRYSELRQRLGGCQQRLMDHACQQRPTGSGGGSAHPRPPSEPSGAKKSHEEKGKPAAAALDIVFLDLLQLNPSPSLTPRQVLEVQCYALHAGRIDRCFTFASPRNKRQFGPLARFKTLFAPPSLYALMVNCDSWEVWQQLEDVPESVAARRTIATEVAIFRRKLPPGPDGRAGREVEQGFKWTLSRQPSLVSAPGQHELTHEEETLEELAGCWMMNSVVPVSREELLRTGWLPLNE